MNVDSERVARIGGALCMLTVFGTAVYFMIQAGISKERSDQIGAFVNFGAVMLCGAVLGLLFVRIYLPHIAEGIVDLLLAPRRFRSRPAPLVTPIRALVKQERYEEAAEQLKKLLEEYPEVPESRILAFDLFSGPLNRPDDAMRTAESYFIRPKREYSEDNAKLLMRYVGLARELGSENDAILLLSSELHRPGTGYTRAERRTLEGVLAGLRTGVSPADR